MDFEKIKLNWKKYTIRTASFLLAIYFTNFLGKIFDPINELLIKALKGHGLLLYSKIVLILNFPIPLYSLFLAIIFVDLVKRFLSWIKVERSGLKIIDAKYGENDKYIDITHELNSLVDNNKLKTVIGNWIAGDPLVGVNKKAIVKYKHNGKPKEITVPEYQIIDLP